MSGTHKERSRRGGGGGGGGGKSGGDDKEEGGGGPTRPEGSDDAAEQRCFGTVKKVSLFRFRKANNNKVHHRRRKRGSFVNSQCGGAGGGGGGGGGGVCCLCMKRPMTVGSSGESPASDPNSAEFSYEMLRGLIEKNDFLGKDCNTHLMDVDVDSSSPSSHIEEKL